MRLLAVGQHISPYSKGAPDVVSKSLGVWQEFLAIVVRAEGPAVYHSGHS